MKKYNKETLDKIFSLFVGDDPLRPVMQKPIDIEGKYLAATDAHVLLIVDKDLCDYESDNPHENRMNIMAVVPHETRSVKLNIQAVNFEEYKTADEYKVYEKKVDCGACHGSGEVEVDFFYKRNYSIDVECPVCDGSGVESEEKKKLTGNKTYPDNCYLQIENAYFKLALFNNIIELQKLANTTELILLNKSVKNSSHLFKVGDFKVVIMPYLKTDEDSEKTIINLSAHATL